MEFELKMKSFWMFLKISLHLENSMFVEIQFQLVFEAKIYHVTKCYFNIYYKLRPLKIQLISNFV